MNLDLIAMLTMLIIFCLFLIGLLFILIIIWSDQYKTDEEKFYEDQEQMEYLKKYNERKYSKK